MKDDLIRRSDVCDAILSLPPKMDEDGYGWLGRRGVWQMVNDIPAVDAVEVVRCAKCVYSHVIEDSFGEQLVCKKYDRLTLATDYCSDGRREDGDA